MASNSSGPLSKNAVYQLGQYQFRLNVTESQEGDSTQIQAQMTKDEQSKYHSIYVDGDAVIDSWSVEANESTADVYAVVKIALPPEDPSKRSPFGEGPWPSVVNYAKRITANPSPTGDKYFETWVKVADDTQRAYVALLLRQDDPPGYRDANLFCGTTPDVEWYINYADGTWPSHGTRLDASYTYQGKTAYYRDTSSGMIMRNVSGGANYRVAGRDQNGAQAAWTILYGTPEYDPEEYTDPEEKLVARFEIDLETADGGPDGDWDEPGDTGDPTYTLNLTVTGASAGTHDALVFPSDNTAEKGYGCGGDGGHGGGGGAGASTVIIYEFATSKAGNVNQEAYTREPGVGSGGGKGGKGGDGCILIYY